MRYGGRDDVLLFSPVAHTEGASSMNYYAIILLLGCLVCMAGPAGADEIIIGAIIDISGDSATYAQGIEAALDLAARDLNDSYHQAGMNTTVTVKKAYSVGTGESAVSAASDLVADGVQIIVGPESSEEVAAILPLLEENRILSINPSSSELLSVPGDPVIRLAPGDSRLARALSVYHAEGEIQPVHLVILARDDVYGRTLAGMVQNASLLSLSGQGYMNDPLQTEAGPETGTEKEADVLLYPPDSSDLSPTLEDLSNHVSSAVEKYGAGNVVIFAVSFDEIADILALASGYPLLGQVRWEGADSVAMNSAILENGTASRFAQETGLTALSFQIAQPAESDYWRVYDAVKAANGGYQPSIYEILVYDETLMAAWIMQSHPSALEDMLYIADSYGKLSYGATGWLKLDAQGDRQFGDYFFYQVHKEGDENDSWIPVAMYLDETASLVPLKQTNNTFMQHYGPGSS